MLCCLNVCVCERAWRCCRYEHVKCEILFICIWSDICAIDGDKIRQNTSKMYFYFLYFVLFCLKETNTTNKKHVFLKKKGIKKRLKLLKTKVYALMRAIIQSCQKSKT